MAHKQGCSEAGPGAFARAFGGVPQNAAAHAQADTCPECGCYIEWGAQHIRPRHIIAGFVGQVN